MGAAMVMAVSMMSIGASAASGSYTSGSYTMSYSNTKYTAGTTITSSPSPKTAQVNIYAKTTYKVGSTTYSKTFENGNGYLYSASTSVTIPSGYTWKSTYSKHQIVGVTGQITLNY